jgi:transposase-like protein
MTSKVDPAGTTPGLVPSNAEEIKKFHMRCKNTTCDSIEATEIGIPGQPHQRVYKCVKCHRTWGANVGGFIPV